MTKLIYYSLLRRMEQWKSREESFEAARFKELSGLSIIIVTSTILWTFPYFIEPIKRIGYGEMDLVSKRGLSMIVVIPLYLVLLFIFNKFYSKKLEKIHNQFIEENSVFSKKERKKDS